MNLPMMIAITGHRPEDCEDEELVRHKLRLGLKDSGARSVIYGGASGVDLWAADEARLLGIETWFYQPWDTHKGRVGETELYDKLQKYSTSVIVVENTKTYPGPWVYQKRNEAMVDAATHILAYYNGKTSGGTYNCLKYAEKVGKPVRNVYDFPPF